jgi:hypothetical protein
MMDSIGNLEELENAFIKNNKKSHPKKHGVNVHISSEAGCDVDGDDEDYDEKSCSMEGFNSVTDLVKNTASEDSESSESWGMEEEEDDCEVGSG